MPRESKSDYWVTVFVPVVVAVIALIGVIVAAVVNSQDDDGAKETPAATVHVLRWSIRQIPANLGQLHVLLAFEGTSANIPRNHSVFILARMSPGISTSPSVAPASPSPSDDLYQVSPPARIDDVGNWSITWELGSVPEFAGYEAVVAPLVQGALPPAGAPDELRKLGSEADVVIAREGVNIPPTP